LARPTSCPAGYAGYIGVPHKVELKGRGLFFRHVHLHAMDERRAIKTLLQV